MIMEESLGCFVFCVKSIPRAGGQEEFFPWVRSVKTIAVLVYLLACSFFHHALKCGEGPACLNLLWIFTFQSSYLCRDLKYCRCLGCPALDLCHCSSLSHCTLKACSFTWDVRLSSDLGCAELEGQKSHELNVFIFPAYDCEVADLMILTSSHITVQFCGLGTLSTEIDPVGRKVVKHHFIKEWTVMGLCEGARTPCYVHAQNETKWIFFFLKKIHLLPRPLPQALVIPPCVSLCVGTMKKQCSWRTAPLAARGVYFFVHPLVWFLLSLLKSFRLLGWGVCAGSLMAWLHVGRCFCEECCSDNLIGSGSVQPHLGTCMVLSTTGNLF